MNPPRKALTLPPDTEQIKWRWMAESDARLVHQVFNEIEELSQPFFRTTFDEVHQLFTQTSKWLGIIGVDRAGHPRAFLHARLKLAANMQVPCNSGTHPDFRTSELIENMLNWQEQAAAQLASTVGVTTGYSIVCSAQYHDLDIYLAALQHRNYEWTSSFHEMRAELDPIPPVGVAGPLIQIEPWNANWENLVRLAALEFAPETVHSQGRSLSQWMSNRNNFDPSLSFVALDRSTDRAEVAGFIMTAKYKEDWEILGWQEGYIDLLEVGPQWRDENVGRELVVAVMHACAEAGLAKVATGVSSHHEAAATRLFGSLGFEEVSQERKYTLEV
ncbi:hypothetical protein BK816_04740 [Boudabousia tangfeifanii]|uniref:N-acetyltransferase domain-containing protein n=1 Tax=Boudabousia tangfeifanii TaxID=1912795 RepID=A0A1D9MK71_9ACTO|nr:GNAT family N-acetyltransferase [Boudabousia tangfeifanii]AOZ72682.1 hypothetical protein BK816_04740 [Boudabousia tangfeifanii]